jgi:deltex-like protein
VYFVALFALEITKSRRSPITPPLAFVMSNNCVVVVWEVESILLKKYVPYSSSVSQHLERAYAKKLTQVFLGDSDASLNEFYVNLRTMKQCSEQPDAEHPLVNVRRQFYNPSSPAGKGIRWEYAGNSTSEWHQYDMEIQCLIEDAWSNGNQQTDISSSYIHMPYIIDFCNMTQTRKPSGPIRQIRRVSQAPYPLTKLPSAMNSQQQAVLNTKQMTMSHGAGLNASRMSINGSRSRRNYLHHQQLLSTSAPRLSNYGDTISQTGSTRSAPAHHTHVTGIPPSGKQSMKAPTKPPKPAKSSNSETNTTSPTNLARQILNNLNIFSHHHHHNNNSHNSDKGGGGGGDTTTHHKKNFIMSHGNSNGLKSSKKALCKNLHSSSTSTLDMETLSMNSRRPSVDTISTYLSSGSKGSRSGSVRGKASYGSVSDLLNCSLSSENDDVFLSSHSSISSSMSMNMIIKGSIVGVDSSSEQISKFVSVVNDIPPSKPCPICLNELHRDNSAKNPSVSLSRCQHLMHLNCLNELILSQKSELQKVSLLFVVVFISSSLTPSPSLSSSLESLHRVPDMRDNLR